MTQVSQGGLTIANHIAAAYRDNPNVLVVMVSGSVARGLADTYSDLEIGVFWAHPPSDDERKTAIARSDGELWSFTSYQREPEVVTHEQYGLSTLVIDGQPCSGSLMVSINHLTRSAMEQCLADVLEHADTALDKQTLIAAVQDAIPLYGAVLLHTWQAQARVYPNRLAIKMIQESLWCGPWCMPQAYAKRDDTLVLYQHFIWMQQSILKILAGLNRVYYRSEEHKWLDAMIQRFSIAPPDLALRMKQAFREDPMIGVRHMLELIHETVLLVEQHQPEVNRVQLFAAHPDVTTTWALRRWEPSEPYALMQAVGAVIAEASRTG
jgi:hypothetical protein